MGARPGGGSVTPPRQGGSVAAQAAGAPSAAARQPADAGQGGNDLSLGLSGTGDKLGLQRMPRLRASPGGRLGE